jgi:hypothetical protein
MRRLGLLIGIILSAGCVGCDNAQEPAEQPAQQQEEQPVGMTNPWVYDVTVAEVKALTGGEFVVPEGAYDVVYAINESDKLAEMNFTYDDTRFGARMMATSEFVDISGDFYEWDAEGVDDIGGNNAQVRSFFTEEVTDVLWNDGERMYSVSTNGADKDGTEVVRVAKIIYGLDAYDVDYDMYGYVVDKNTDEEYAHHVHYNVKGDNDEIFVCNFNGTDELSEGTYVGMYKVGEYWNINVVDEAADEDQGGAVITDENGVSVTDMEITINTPTTCYFDFTLHNPEGKDVKFDQTRMRLENYDGTVLDPFGDDKDPIDASAQVERHSYTMDIGNIKNGDEISVYYDDRYVTSIFAGGGPATDDADLSDVEDFFSNIDLEEYTKMLQAQAEEGEKKFPVTLKKQDSSKDVNPVDEGLFITADKVECRRLELSCPNDVFSFGMELYNNTGKDQTFDQTKFVIEIKDGEYVNPFVFEQVRQPETVSGEAKRLWMAYTIYNPKNLKAGDEVSIYYDGVFITKLKVEE